MYVIGTGMVTSVGPSSASSCAAMRAKVAGFAEVPYTDISNEPVVGAPVSFVQSLSKGIVRLVDLAVPALKECCQAIPQSEVARTPLLLALADSSRPSTIAEPVQVLRELKRRVGVEFGEDSCVLPYGAIGGAIALQHAQMLIEKRGARYCIVGGVDSFLDQRQLRWLERGRRLKRPNQPDGLIPGEAASFVLVSAKPPQRDASAAVIGIGTSSSSPDDKSQPRAASIVSAMRTAIANAGVSTSQIRVEITDLTGERDLAVDHAIAVTRTFIDPQPKLHYWHMAMSLGSVGAASIPCAVTWALQAAVRGYAPGVCAMCTSISEPSAKGAVLVALQGH
jgi:3-oxoacyl-[acyl-carrier-protein] synthase I